MSSNTTQAEEDFEFAPIENSGKVNVQNLAYGEEEAKDHIYTVSVQDGEAFDCTCPGHGFGSTTKHVDAVENNEEVLAAADPDPLAPVERADECPACDGTGTIGRWACFSCIEISEAAQ